MSTVNTDKLNFKFNDVKWFISIAVIVATGIWRFETRMANIEANLDSSIAMIRKDLMYSYTVEIMKLNNRIDLLEATKFSQVSKPRVIDTLFVNETISNKKSLPVDNRKPIATLTTVMLIPRQLELEKRINSKFVTI
jgi:hypothetical protein